MPNIKSAKKRMRQALVRRDRNRAVNSALKTEMRKVRDAAANGKTEDAAKELPSAYKKLDQAAAKGVIHKNKASRLKSRLSARVKAAKSK
jgi:small subunit ribosomal protein S20